MEIECFARRRDSIAKLLVSALRKRQIRENSPGAISINQVLRGVSRELAMIWEAGQRSDADKRVFAKVARIKKLTAELLALGDSLAGSGVSGDMMRALIGVATANVYSNAAVPKRGRKNNLAALQVAARFAEFYPMITARKIGKNADHDFVQTLGEIFEILDFKVNPQYYARKVAVGFAGSDVS